MVTLYIILLVVISLVINVSVTLAMPYVKQQWSAFITRIKRKRNTPKQPIGATQYLELSSRIDEIEKRLGKRQSNFRWIIKEEIKNILLELKK